MNLKKEYMISIMVDGNSQRQAGKTEITLGSLSRKPGTKVLKGLKGKWDPMVNLDREQLQEAASSNRACGTMGKWLGLVEPGALMRDHTKLGDTGSP